MGDFPAAGRRERQAITTMSFSAIGDIRAAANIAWASATWVAANVGMFIPCRVGRQGAITSFFWENGATANANIDCGLYNRYGKRIASTTPTTQSGVSTIQVVNITPVTIQPDLYWMALVFSNATGTIIRINPALGILRAWGVYEATGVGTLPDPVTFAANTRAFLPHFGFSLYTV